ncbi:MULTISPECIES: polysaccharide biosynthesis protein [Actinomyces]|uniref:Polysaccharide biosynthesis protein n=1 Tax=Actinomyces respiraculi TaxID=2744574 RepID=A0A7T0LLP4_9ACTO|nr:MULTISPECIES: polysaccharide biosynthesis protein [Actinomyces]QPL06076.1 polysaccharide biosynthesis protein [Actinomyces respiraculi]
MNPAAKRAWAATDVGGSRLHLPHGTIPLLDSVMWAVSLVLVAGLNAEALAHANHGWLPLSLALSIALAVGLHLALYTFVLRGRARFASVDEYPLIMGADALVTSALMILAALLGTVLLPAQVCFYAGAVALTLHFASRWVFVRLVELRHRPQGVRARRTIVLGAGFGGTQAVSLMLEDRSSTFQPVAFLDDDPRKRHLRVSGVRVLGPWNSLERVAAETKADLVLLAVPSASAEQVDQMVRRARALGLEVRVMPSPEEIVDRFPGLGSRSSLIRSTQVFRPLEISDLLGRRAIETDVTAICGYLTGERVLVTGAGGSIGSQLCKEIAKYSPARLIMVDRDESALHSVQLALDGEGMLDSPDLVLGDLRTPGLIDALMEEYQPRIVFHAAALKHLTLTERFPEEAFLTNVAATRDLLLAAAAHGVQRFINISTDKAADPECVLGYSKRLAERLTSTVGLSLDPDRRFISVRFGNVLGSRGSALLTFASQLERGLPMTITDPKMERFFMSVDEACQLVLQAGVLGHSGEVLVLDMGKAHKIEDIARRFALLLGYPDAEVVYTRMRPGEKLAETLFGVGEQDERPYHPLVAQTKVPPLGQQVLQDIVGLREQTEWGQHGALVHRWMEDTSQAGARK